MQFSLILFQLFIQSRLQRINDFGVEVAAPVNLDPDRMDEVHVDVTGGQDVVGHFDDFVRIRFHSFGILILQARFHAFKVEQVFGQNRAEIDGSCWRICGF